LRKTIEHLALQKTNLQWEFILVDNASTDGSADYVESLWREFSSNVPLHIVNERQPGLVYARIAGVNAAQGKYIVFCDDDNWLQEDYIQSAYELMEQMPNVGVLGGQSVLAPGIEAPEWWSEQQGNYAVGKQLPQSGFANERGFLYGAGMTTRTELARIIFDEHYPFLLTGRKGDQCLSGEDGEYCTRVRLMGYNLYYSEDLFYWHDIDPSRLTGEYLQKLLRSFDAGAEIEEKYRYAITYSQTSRGARIKWMFIRTWNYITASKKNKWRKKQLLYFHLYLLGAISKKDNEFDTIVKYIQHAQKIGE
jgi:glycosyltransferase involved in cell wall biosynthesis